MKDKDTVMSKETIDTFNRYRESVDSEDDWDLWGLLEAQAEISFKAGREYEHKIMIGVAVDEGNIAFKNGKDVGILERVRKVQNVK